MNLDILKFLNPKDNDKLSGLNSKELKEMLNLLNQYYLTLRDNLNIDKNNTFGFEIEFEDALIDNIFYYLQDYLNKAWIVREDGSIPTGGEVNTPVLYDTRRCWNELYDVCEILKKHAIIGPNCGGHIHIGAQIVENDKNFFKIIKTWTAFEEIIYRFSSGEFTHSRPNIIMYASPISKMLHENNVQNRISVIKKLLLDSKVDGISMKSTSFKEYITGNTIEIRCPNGSYNPIVLQNNLNFFIKFFEYSKSKYNEDIINYEINRNIAKYNNYQITDYDLLESYNDIYLEKALLLSDLIFDNNLDKLYFLRQYLKSFDKSKEYIKAKKFTSF